MNSILPLLLVNFLNSLKKDSVVRSQVRPICTILEYIHVNKHMYTLWVGSFPSIKLIGPAKSADTALQAWVMFVLSSGNLARTWKHFFGGLQLQFLSMDLTVLRLPCIQ